MPPAAALPTIDPNAGPAIAARRFLAREEGLVAQLLTPRQRQQLLDISTIVKLGKGQFFYREGQEAKAIFIGRTGSLKTFRVLPSGAKRIKSFIFPRDLFGLAEGGHYVNTARALTPASAYRIELEDLVPLLQRDAALEYQFLIKLTHEIRESQRRIIMLARKDAIGRLAMFLVMLRDRNVEAKSRDVVALPMSRSDIADFVGHSLETVSRATTKLVKQGLVTFDGRHQVRILDTVRLERIAASV